MTHVNQSNILEALASIVDQGRDILSAGIISGLAVNDGKVSFVITVSPSDIGNKSWLQEACEKAVKSVPGVKSVSVVMTAQTEGKDAGDGVRPVTPPRRAVWNTEPLQNVSRIIAVASGKGGVGKSTTAVNIAHALGRLGKKVGVLDADIYGPSLPRMMGLDAKPDIIDNRIIPLMSHGIACMSMGFLIDEKSAIIWRGPQVTKALQQMLRDVVWGTSANPLDVLLIDMPPGTGDVHLSLAQQVPVNGVVIVTTPQDVAVADALKSIDMFHKVNVPIIGVIENMSGFTDPATGVTHAIFGTGGGRRLAAATSSPFLGGIPIDLSLREASDTGACYEDKLKYFSAIAEQLL